MQLVRMGRRLVSWCLGARASRSVTVPLVWILVVAVAQSGCGFQLRGVTELPAVLKTTYLSAENAPADFVDELKGSLRDAGAALVQEPSVTGAVLKILEVSDDRRVLSVNSITGKVQEYELNYIVRFSLADGRGKTLVEPQTIRLSRDYRFSDTEVLGKSVEEAQLKREMQRDMVQQLLRRLQAQAG